MDNKKEDVFRDAREKALQEQMAESTKALVLNNKEDLLPVIRERLEEGETQWDLLRKMIDGSMTERFIKILSTMPDRDFARNYLKLLEHFKPKVTRSEGGEDEQQDLTVNIQMVTINKEGEKQIISVDEIKEDESEEN